MQLRMGRVLLKVGIGQQCAAEGGQRAAKSRKTAAEIGQNAAKGRQRAAGNRHIAAEIGQSAARGEQCS